MRTRLVEVRLGDEIVLVEAVVPAGSENISSSRENAQKLLRAFDAARGVIVGMAAQVVEVSADLAALAAQPDEIELDFGLKIATTGSIVVAAASAEASLTVKLTYKSAFLAGALSDG